MKLSLIVAMAENNCIGNKNQLPWRLSADLQYFKKLTTGKTIIMGRKTYESIGKPLPNRCNVILTRNAAYEAEDCTILPSLEVAMSMFVKAEEVFVIGGANIYEQAIDYCETMYITEVKAEVKGDAYFPKWNTSEWREVSREAHQADEKNQFDYDFVTYARV
tara:strand:- start:56569 stop:57054 length:486 start_codon:yes stop_codon:yes gene_type:complete